MKTSVESIPGQKAVLTIELEPPEMERSLRRASDRLSQKVAVPGFRKGKTPRTVLEHYLGREALVSEAIEIAVPEYYGKAVEEQKLDPIALPELDVVQREPLTFKAVIPLRPTIELGSYDSLKIEGVSVQVKEEQVSRVIEQLRYRAAPWEPVDNRPVHFGDLVSMDVEGTEKGRVILHETGVEWVVDPDAEAPVPGFNRQLEGMEQGQSKSFTLSFPPNYARPELAGGVYSFMARIHTIKEKRLASLDDELARSIDESVKTVDELRTKVSADLQKQSDTFARRIMEERALEALVGASKAEYPAVMLDKEIDDLLKEQENRLRDRQLNLDEYLSRAGKTKEQLRDELRPQAIRNLVRSLVLHKFIEAEGIQVIPEELQQEMETLTKAGRLSPAQARRLLSSPEAKESLEHDLHTRKALALLLEKVKVEPSEVEVPPQATGQETESKLILPGATSGGAAESKPGIILPEGIQVPRAGP